MSNIYTLIAELIFSNAQRDIERSRDLSNKAFAEVTAINNLTELLINEAAKLQPVAEQPSTSLN